MAIKRADLAELEYALKNTELSTFDEKEGRFTDLPEEDPDEIVAEVTGFSTKAEAVQGMLSLPLFSSSPI
jgi:hypothetical protein